MNVVIEIVALRLQGGGSPAAPTAVAGFTPLEVAKLAVSALTSVATNNSIET
jgi:hypothetical protein